jgi:hypothetical protein
MKVPTSATLVFGKAKQVDRWLDADDWYALVFEIADLLRQGVKLKEYEALNIAANWLRGYGTGNG